VIHVAGESRVRLRIHERSRQKNLLDGLSGGLDGVTLVHADECTSYICSRDIL
jgi:hypothetical protein